MEVLGPTMHDFKPPTIMLSQSELGSTKGHGLDMDLGLQMKNMGM
jgi:hypothetical protein